MSWLGTNDGNIIDLNDTDPTQITIEDIATGLSKICRFNGQLQTWYSVAEHSINVMSLVPKWCRLHALLHDASEAYICDIPTPLKRMLGSTYLAIENQLQDKIGCRFGVNLVNLPAVVKDADRVMTVSERDAFTYRPRKWEESYEDSIRYPRLTRRFDTPDKARRAFLDAFAEVYTLSFPVN